MLTNVNKSAAGFPPYFARKAAPRSGGAVPSSTLAPWQLAQFCWYAAFPATACADVNSASPGGGTAPPGACACNSAGDTNATKAAIAPNKPAASATRHLFPGFLDVMLEDTSGPTVTCK